MSRDVTSEREIAAAKAGSDISERMRMIFGENCKAARKAAGLSQAALGSRTGFPQTMVSEIELGKVNITLQTMVLIAKALNVELSALIATPPGK